MTDLPVSQLGQYELIEKLGQGGMATVYKARQPNMDRIVAIKVLPPALRLDPEFATRFRQEAKIIASLEHARILPVHDYGEEGDYTFLVMRFLEGNTLHQRIKAEGPFSLQEATRVMRQVAEGLQYAHSKNIIHRDMSSNNVMFDSVGNAYITDFGLAKIVAGSARLTGHSVVGTPAYVAPEQVMGEKPDPRTDIYALGVVLFEMLVGDVPFQGDTPMVVIFQHVNDPLPDPRESRPDLPDAVAEVILRATEKDPNNRFNSTLEMADALEQAVRGIAPTEAAAKPDKVSFAGNAFKPDYLEKTAAARQSATRRSSPPAATVPVVERPSGGTPAWLLPLLGVVALLLIGVVGLVVLQPSLFGLAPVSTATQQAAALPSATTGEAASQPPQPSAAPSSTAPGIAQPTEAAANPTQDVPPTLTAPPTLPGQPTGQPPLFLGDTQSLPCAEGEQPLFAVDFDESQPEERSVLLGADASLPTFSGIWLEIPPMPPQRGIALQAQAIPTSPHITAKVAWRANPGVFGLIISVGTPPESPPFALFVGPQIELKRGPNNLATAPAPAVFDGESHIIEYIAENGHFVALIDGVMVLEMTEPNPEAIREIAIRAEGSTVSLDSLTVCEMEGG